ncbi:hypothetical protein HanIR_Chr10g0458651 [Helianthus annuus]|nr:hypothetical protein HanIR_Chr10g0458651 [Helianthus annuus]
MTYVISQKINLARIAICSSTSINYQKANSTEINWFSIFLTDSIIKVTGRKQLQYMTDQKNVLKIKNEILDLNFEFAWKEFLEKKILTVWG